MQKYLFPALLLGFLLVSIVTFINSQPQTRNKRVYSILKEYMPYKFEKKLSGLVIIDKKTGKKYKPKSSDLFHVLDNLEKDWGDKHLFREGDKLIVVDDENKTIKTITLKDDKERAYIKEFFNK